MDSKAKIVIQVESDLKSKIFNFVESFFAFGMATVIIIAAGYRFPIYLIGFCYAIMILFAYLVYGKKDVGLSFLIAIYSILGVNALLLAWVSF